MKRNVYLLSLLCLLLSFYAFGQKKPFVYATVSKDKIAIGEQVDLIVGVRFAPSAAVSFFHIDSIPHFEIIQRYKIDTQSTSADVHLFQRIVVTSWDSGRWNLPSFTLPQVPAQTKPIAISVMFSSFDPKQDYHDIKDVVDVKKSAPTRWYWYVIGGVLLLILFLLLFPKKKKEIVLPKENAHAYKDAIAELHQLQKDATSPEDVKAFYIKLINVLRKYLHRKKGIASYSKTTEDIAVQLQGMNLPLSLHQNLIQSLRLSDAVKFAKYRPDEEENLLVVETIIKSVEAIEKT